MQKLVKPNVFSFASRVKQTRFRPVKDQFSQSHVLLSYCVKSSLVDPDYFYVTSHLMEFAGKRPKKKEKKTLFPDRAAIILILQVEKECLAKVTQSLQRRRREHHPS